MRKHTVGALLFWATVLAGPVRAELNPEQPIEYVPFQGHKGVKPTFSVDVSYQPGARVYVYTYGVSLDATSTQPLGDFDIGTGAQILEMQGPNNSGWGGFARSRAANPQFEQDSIHYGGLEHVTWNASLVEQMIQPGKALQGIVMKTPAAPGFGVIYARGDVAPPSGQQILLAPPPGYSLDIWEDCVKVNFVVPEMVPPSDPIAQIDRLFRLVQQAATGGWIQDQKLLENLTTQLMKARGKLVAGRADDAREILLKLSRDLRGRKGDDDSDPDGDDHKNDRGHGHDLGHSQGRGHHKSVTPQAIELLQANLAPLLSTLARGSDDDDEQDRPGGSGSVVDFWGQAGPLGLVYLLSLLALRQFNRRYQPTLART